MAMAWLLFTTSPHTQSPAQVLMDSRPLAINRLAALHPRERLLVHPVCWSRQQLDLLQCRFVEGGEAARPGTAEAEPDLAGKHAAVTSLAQAKSYMGKLQVILPLIDPFIDTSGIKYEYVLIAKFYGPFAPLTTGPASPRLA
jgi:hypothetical protein